MNKTLAILVTGLSLAGLCAAAVAQQLPKSGSISIHTGWKDTGEALDVADKRMQGHGSVIGTSFNDKGVGPLHGGPATCFYTFFLVDGTVKNKGYCAFGDVDGDRIFTDWNGGSAGGGGLEGVNKIVGGTGKYAGAQGSGPWKCADPGKNGQLSCTQRFDYRLP